jgi:hypothetical protein
MTTGEKPATEELLEEMAEASFDAWWTRDGRFTKPEFTEANRLDEIAGLRAALQVFVEKMGLTPQFVAAMQEDLDNRFPRWTDKEVLVPLCVALLALTEDPKDDQN